MDKLCLKKKNVSILWRPENGLRIWLKSSKWTAKSGFSL